MDIKECHRVLELEIGASCDAVQTAYLRLLEHWHPDRVIPAGDPAAILEATRMVQAVNEAYQTLIKVAPSSVTEPTAGRKKPALPPLTTAVAPTDKAPPPGRPIFAPPALPPPAAISSFPPPPAFAPPTQSPSPASSTKHGLSGTTAPIRGGEKTLESPTRPTGQSGPGPESGNGAPPPPPPPSNTIPLSPQTTAPTSGPGNTGANSPTSSETPSKPIALLDALFPGGSPKRRFSTFILIAALLFLFLMVRCACSSPTPKIPPGPDPTKTGSVVFKSNRPDTEVELVGAPGAGASTPASFHSSGAESAVRGLPPGKYALTAKSAGWPEIRQEVSVEIGHSTEIPLHFKSGSLRLTSDPAGAAVKLAGATLGKTPLVIAQLPPGECLLSIEYPTWPVASLKIAITENVESTENVRLPHGKLVVESNPSGATVLFGTRAVGQTPLTLDQVPAGTRKFTLQAKAFPNLEVSFTVADQGEVTVSRELGSGFPELNVPTLLRAVWVPEDPNKLSPGVDTLGRYEPRNGIVRNLHRKRLYENWLERRYRYSATIKSYDRETGKIEFAEQGDALSRYRILAELAPAVRNNADLTAQLTKGSTINLYGKLDAVEEPRWPFKVITFELSSAETLH